MRYVDLSHTIHDGMITYKGLPAPIICDFYSRDESIRFYDGDTSFQIGQVTMVGNTGTYMDCPFHRFKDGKDFSELFLSDMADLDGIRISVPHFESLSIEKEHLSGLDVRGKAVLLHTGWDQFWRQDQYFENHPFLSKTAAEYLRSQQVKVVGIDSHNMDDTRGKTRPAHTILLEAGILVVEHLCQLHLVPANGFYFTAVPPRIKGTGSFPVRAFAKF
ncbi:MAG: cyclase family protein [Saprospiraceae bacterium]|nr:cyclase family protein [Saprospiraceae bacterium]